MRLRRLRLVALLGCTVALLAACTAAAPPGEVADDVETRTAPSPTVLDEDHVDLTLYFRDDGGDESYLVPVSRQVPVGDDLPRAALELLLAGPTEDDGSKLVPPLPTSTEVLGFRIVGHTAHVDLSIDVIEDADTVARTPDHEALALAAIVDTLSEFPLIDRVRLTVEGRSDGEHDGVDVSEFWGGWGLPALLVRDTSVIEPGEGEVLPDLELFSRSSQSIGSSEVPAVTITSVRVRDRTTYLRLSIELTDADGGGLDGQVPATRARSTGEDLILEIRGVGLYDADFGEGQRLELEDPSFEALEISAADLPGTVRITLLGTENRAFLLHSLTSPTRVVLDVKKQSMDNGETE